MISYSLQGMRTYKQENVFNQLSKFGQWVIQKIDPILEINLPGPLQKYAHFSGINTGYCLFAPNVPYGLGVAFEIRNDQDTILSMPLLNTREGLDRFNGNYNIYGAIEEIQDLLAYGWALRMLENHPKYNEIEVVVGLHRQPTMFEYRELKHEPHFVEANRFIFQLDHDE